MTIIPMMTAIFESYEYLQRAAAGPLLAATAAERCRETVLAAARAFEDLNRINDVIKTLPDPPTVFWQSLAVASPLFSHSPTAQYPRILYFDNLDPWDEDLECGSEELDPQRRRIGFHFPPDY